MERTNKNDDSTISVVVPTTGDGSLPRLRLALGEQILYPGEIIIVQNKDKHGAAWARNQGIKKAIGKFIVFLASIAMLTGMLIPVIKPELSILGLAQFLEDTEHA